MSALKPYLTGCILPSGWLRVSRKHLELIRNVMGWTRFRTIYFGRLKSEYMNDMMKRNDLLFDLPGLK